MPEVAVSHRFGTNGFAFDVAFSAPPTGVTALFGPSGCGKSTVLAAVAGLLRPDKGRITVGETVLLDTAQGISLPPERRRCGVVFQDARLFPHLSVAANLRYGMRRAPPDAEGPSFDEVVAMLGIGSLLSGLPPYALYVIGNIRIGEAMAIIAAGVAFNLARKLVTLGQW